jgi:hypothetical protein
MPPGTVLDHSHFLMEAANKQKFYFTTIKTYEMNMVSRWNPEINKRSKPDKVNLIPMSEMWKGNNSKCNNSLKPGGL